MNRVTLCALCIVALTAPAAGLAAQDLMKPYPDPGPGMVRTVIELPARQSEGDHKVELLVGKVVDVDCNKSFFGGTLERRVAEGWGYPYFVIERVGPRASTRMVCPPGTEASQAFVALGGEGSLQRYNSKLPVVVYVPVGFEVRYRIWSAGDRSEPAEPR